MIWPNQGRRQFEGLAQCWASPIFKETAAILQLSQFVFYKTLIFPHRLCEGNHRYAMCIGCNPNLLYYHTKFRCCCEKLLILNKALDRKLNISRVIVPHQVPSGWHSPQQEGLGPTTSLHFSCSLALIPVRVFFVPRSSRSLFTRTILNWGLRCMPLWHPPGPGSILSSCVPLSLWLMVFPF